VKEATQRTLPVRLPMPPRAPMASPLLLKREGSKMKKSNSTSRSGLGCLLLIVMGVMIWLGSNRTPAPAGLETGSVTDVRRVANPVDSELSGSLESAWRGMRNVRKVGVAMVMKNSATLLAAGEVCVMSGLVALEMAEQLMAAAQIVAGGALPDFSVILTDGNFSVDFVYSLRRDGWTETVITDSAGTTCD
jgi:hypothetical protein